MHDRQVPALAHISVERFELALGRAGVRPQPVLDVDGPVDDVRVWGEVRGEALAGARADSAVGGTEVGC